MKKFTTIIFHPINRLCHYILYCLKTGQFWRRLLSAAGCGLLLIFVIVTYWFQGINITKIDTPLPAPTTILDRYGQKAIIAVEDHELSILNTCYVNLFHPFHFGDD